MAYGIVAIIIVVVAIIYFFYSECRFDEKEALRDINELMDSGMTWNQAQRHMEHASDNTRALDEANKVLKQKKNA